MLLMRYVELIIRESDIIPRDDKDKVELIVFTLLGRILTPELFLEYHEHKGAAERFFTNDTITAMRRQMDEDHEMINSLESQLMNYPAIIECMCQFWLTLHLGCLISKDRGYAEYNISRVRKIDNSAEPLTTRDLNSIRRNTKRNIKQFKQLIIDRASDKFDPTASQITRFISSIAVLIIPAGHLYNYILLGSFGIDSSNYFTIPDYVSSSITAIRESIASTLFFFVGVVVSRLRVSKERVRRVLDSKYRMSISVKRPPQPWFGWYLLICSTMMAIALFYIGSSSFYTLAGFSGTSILVMIVDKYVFRYFKNPITVRTVIIGVALFGMALWSSASSRVFELRNGFEHDSKNYTVHLKQEWSLPSSDLVILTSTSEYYILITRELNVYVVDRESIQYIDVKSNQHWLKDVWDSLTL